LIGVFRRYEDELNAIQRRISTSANNLIIKEKARTDTIASKIAHAATKKISLMHRDIARFEAMLRLRPLATVEKRQAKMDSILQKITLLDQANVLKRGYSITYLNGKPVKNAGEVEDGNLISTRLHEGIIKSKVVDNINTKGGQGGYRAESLF